MNHDYTNDIVYANTIMIVNELIKHYDFYKEQLDMQDNPETARFPDGPSTPEERARLEGFNDCIKLLVRKLPFCLKDKLCHDIVERL
jgi:hypothetical protein